MLLPWIWACFGAVVTLIALCLLPGIRAVAGSCAAQAATLGQRPLRRQREILLHIQRWNSARARTAFSVWQAAAGVIARRPWLLVGMILLVVGPSLLAFTLRGSHVLEFAEDTRDANAQVAALLRGEQLTPPAPLPPDVFITAEVSALRPELDIANRDWGLLDVEFRQRLLLAFRLMRQRHGYEMALLEGYRSAQRQTHLHQAGVIVTHAAANQSYHQFGLAADSAFIRDGRLIIDERDPWALRGYRLFGEVADELGLTWGGDWRLRDYGHVELRRAGLLVKN